MEKREQAAPISNEYRNGSGISAEVFRKYPMSPGNNPPTRLQNILTTICIAVHRAKASDRRILTVLSDRKGTWLTQTQAIAIPPIKENAKSDDAAVEKHRPICDPANRKLAPNRKVFRLIRSLSIPIGKAKSPVAKGPILAICPIKSSRKLSLSR